MLVDNFWFRDKGFYYIRRGRQQEITFAHWFPCPASPWGWRQSQVEAAHIVSVCNNCGTRSLRNLEFYKGAASKPAQPLLLGRCSLYCLGQQINLPSAQERDVYLYIPSLFTM